jgi:hypothetical protein
MTVLQGRMIALPVSIQLVNNSAELQVENVKGREWMKQGKHEVR